MAPTLLPACLCIVASLTFPNVQKPASAQPEPPLPFSAVLTLDEIDRAVERRVESKETLTEIDNLCEAIRPTIKVDAGRI